MSLGWIVSLPRDVYRFGHFAASMIDSPREGFSRESGFLFLLMLSRAMLRGGISSCIPGIERGR